MDGVTRSGQRVVGLQFKPTIHCCNGESIRATYPVKGSIVRREKPWKVEYTIWSEDGKCDIVYGTRSGDDLVDFDIEQLKATKLDAKSG